MQDAGVSDAHTYPLAEVCERFSALPYAEVRQSTNGSGLHVRIRLATPVPALTRVEYLATVRHVFECLCKKLPDLDLPNKIDTSALGRGNLWVWTISPTADSFRLLSAAAYLKMTRVRVTRLLTETRPRPLAKLA